MQNKIIKKCPVCGGDLYAAELKCGDCGITINGEFSLLEVGGEAVASPLVEEEIRFIKVFLKYEGNLSKIGQSEDLSYSEIKEKLKELNIKIGNVKEEENMGYVENLQSNGGSRPSDIIIEKMNEVKGSASCEMLKGDPIRVKMTKAGIVPLSFPALVCEWEIFDAIVEKAKELGGKMYRGDAAAQKGEKIGSEVFPLDTIDAFISLKYYNGEIGKSTTRRSTYYAAILAWAGICQNCRSDGRGGYIRLL